MAGLAVDTVDAGDVADMVAAVVAAYAGAVEG